MSGGVENKEELTTFPIDQISLATKSIGIHIITLMRESGTRSLDVLCAGRAGRAGWWLEVASSICSSDSFCKDHGEDTRLQIQATDDTHVSACKGISAFEKGKKKKKKKKCNKAIPM